MSLPFRASASLLACVVALCALAGGSHLGAQSMGVSVAASGSFSGVPRGEAERMSVYAVATPSQQLEVHLSGPAGKTAALLIGATAANIPVPPGSVLVDPLVILTSAFDAGGGARFSMPLPNAPNATVYMQGIAVDVQNPAGLFAFTWRLAVTIIPAVPPATAFDAGTAVTLLDLAWDAYEYANRKGPLREGSRLAGGYQVLSKISSPNPPNDPWFRQLAWPDTQLFIARNPAGDLAVVFRGTDIFQPRDWATDLAIPQSSGFHLGFLVAYASVHAKVDGALRRFLHPHARVHFTGHSLGGALAPVAAFQLAPTLRSLGVIRENIVLYAFAGPRAMNPQRAAELATRVPHHFAVVNKDDLVTHVPVSFGSVQYEHIPRMRVLYPRRAMVTEAGADYASALLPPLTPLVAAHYQDVYHDRLSGILGAPRVWLSVASSGYMRVHWSFPDRQQWGFARDFIALYRGRPDPGNPGGYVLNAWQWASSSGSYVTGVAKDRDLHVAYVQQYSAGGEQKILGTGGPYLSSTPRVWLTSQNSWARLHWSMADAGAFDFVALYDRNPHSAGPTGYLTGQWQWAVGGSSWTSWTRWRSGLWIAYIASGSRSGPGRITAVAGPY